MAKRNTSRAGYFGELIASLDLLKHGYNVYKPLVDDDGVDLLVEKTSPQYLVNKYTAIQVKYSNCYGSKSSIGLDVKKSRADYIALVCKDENDRPMVLYIKNKKKNSRWSKNIQIIDSKNNQKKDTHSYKKYLKPNFIKWSDK